MLCSFLEFKSKRLNLLLKKLALEQRGWVIVDNWDADLCATGIAAAHNLKRLVYVSVWRKKAGRYVYECEISSSNPDECAAVAQLAKDADYPALLAALEAHLDHDRSTTPDRS